jgi:hypothetical protein
MNQRERILAIAVGALGVIFVAQYGLTSLRSGFDRKQKELENLQKEVDNKRSQVNEGIIALRKLKEVTPSSLPKDPEKARFDYNKWLQEVVHSRGFTSATSSVLTAAPIAGAYTRYKFNVAGQGSLEQIVDLVYTIYQQNYLHRISKLSIKPTLEMGRLDFSIDIEAAALFDAELNQPIPSTPSKRMSIPRDAYVESIVRRNMFGPENQAPKLAEARKERVEMGRTAEGTVRADDPDKGQTLSYEIAGQAPASAEVDPQSGRWKFTPSEKGTFKLLVRATDSGFPAKTAEQLIEIEVVDPPPPQPVVVVEKPKFDTAAHTFITAIISGRKGPEVWLLSRTDNQTIIAMVGDQIELGSLKGKLVEIGKDFIVVETEGRRWTAGMDESLSAAFNRSADD